MLLLRQFGVRVWDWELDGAASLSEFKTVDILARLPLPGCDVDAKTACLLALCRKSDGNFKFCGPYSCESGFVRHQGCQRKYSLVSFAHCQTRHTGAHLPPPPPGCADAAKIVCLLTLQQIGQPTAKPSQPTALHFCITELQS